MDMHYLHVRSVVCLLAVLTSLPVSVSCACCINLSYVPVPLRCRRGPYPAPGSLQTKVRAQLPGQVCQMLTFMKSHGKIS